MSEISMDFILHLYDEFYMFFADEIEQMKKTTHHKIMDDGSVKVNKNHMEGDIWSHTCLVFNEFLKIMRNRNKLDYNDVYLCIASLTHDLGKMKTRDENKGKITFYSHPFASIQYAIDFINYVSKKVYIGENPHYYILNPISNHIDFLRCETEKHLMYSNYDPDLIYINSLLCYCDSNGRITTDENAGRIDNIENTISIRNNVTKPTPHKSSVEIIFLCGVPGAGKNYILNNYFPNTPSISYDDIRLKYYRMNSTSEELRRIDPKEEYQKAFNYCNKQKIDLNGEVNREFKNLLFDGYRSVIINNTNLSKRRRKSMIRLLGKNNYHKAIYIVRDTPSIIIANEVRPDKKLPEYVVNKFLYNQPIPTQQEGFDDVEIFDNCTGG